MRTNIFAVSMIYLLKKKGDGLSSVFDQMIGFQLIYKT